MKRNNTAILMTIAMAAVLLMGSCSKNDGSSNNLSVTYLTDSLRKVVTVETVQNHAFADELVLNGHVDCDPNNVAHIFPMFGGTVIRMGATVGDYVHKGQVLAIVRSGEVADYEKQKNDADLQLITARREKSAMHDMYKGGMASDRDLLQADQTLKNAQAERRRLREIYAIDHIVGPSTYAIKAPISGFITEANINPDMQIRPDQDEQLFTIAGLFFRAIIMRGRHRFYRTDEPLHVGLRYRHGATIGAALIAILQRTDTLYDGIEYTARVIRKKQIVNKRYSPTLPLAFADKQLVRHRRETANVSFLQYPIGRHFGIGTRQIAHHEPLFIISLNKLILGVRIFRRS